ncbi:MAG: OmpA family protein [Crocinitomicaceae bacterium]|nr:OmpA family protein [Crocinitomicaceae bacterium]
MDKIILVVFLCTNLFAIGQIDDSLNSLSITDFRHFTDTIILSEEFEVDVVKNKGLAKIMLFKSLYIQKYHGAWMYDQDSCSIKRINASKMAYFSTGTQAIFCGLSFDTGVKNRKTFRGVSYPILQELAIGDTLRFLLTTLADHGSKFQPDIYTSKKVKVKRGKLKNGKYLTYFGVVPIASENDHELVQNLIEIPITKDNEGIKWVHIINNEEEQHRGFIIESEYHLEGTMDGDYDRVYFNNDSYQLKNDGKLLLDKIVAELTSSNAIVLRGYADPSGQREYNMRLAKNRAQAVMDYLIKKGVDPSRINIEELDILHNKLAKENRICTILVL